MAATLPQSFLEKAKQLAEKKAIRVLKRIGEECVAEAVSSGSYTDKTGNLRSSIGYAVGKDGHIVEEGGFWNIGTGEGVSVGRAKAQSLVASTSGLTLVIVAGMDYAQYVSDRGYDVLDSAEILMQKLIAQLNG